MLNEHDGCTKCRRFYTDHRSQSCPNGFPVGKGYKALRCPMRSLQKKSKAVTKTSTKVVAATTEDIDSDEEINAATAVLPNSPGTFDSDSEDYDMLSDRDIMSCSLCAKHLLWDCQIHSLTSDFPVKMRALLDNSAHLVLIRPELVDQLGLKMYHLHMPEIVDIAFSNEKKKTTELYHYVKLSLMSLDAHWTSRTVKAFVMPGLCTPIILGLPWLIHNSIVTDHTACTCIDKKTSYDLLNPPVIVPPPPPKPKLHEQIIETKADKKLVLTELMMVCNEWLKDPKHKPEKIEDFNVAATVWDRIETLASIEALKKCEDKLKKQFKQIFEPIPHVDELP